MDPINPDKTESEIETDDVTISAPDSPPASGANNDANLEGQQQQPQPQQAQGPGQSDQVGGAAGSWQLPTMESFHQLVTALEHPNYNPQQHQQDCTVKKQQGKKSTTIFMGEKSTWTIIGK